MKIKYNEIEKSIEIKDEIKTHHYLTMFLLGLNFVNVFLQLFFMNREELGFIGYLFIGIAVVSIMILYMFIFKKSRSSKLSLGNIKSLKEKSFFGKKRFYLELSNGKKRDLTDLKTQAEIKELKELFSEIGITH